MKNLSTITLNHSQQSIIALIIGGKDSPLSVVNAIRQNPNLVGAKNTLMDLNAIEYNPVDKKMSLTSLGKQIGVDNEIIDSQEALTQVGQKILSSIEGFNSNDTNNAEFNMDTDNLPTDDTFDDQASLYGESFSPLFKSLLFG